MVPVCSGRERCATARVHPIEARPLGAWESFARRTWRARLRIGIAVVIIALLGLLGGLLWKEKRAADRLKLANYAPGILQAVEKMGCGRFTTRIGAERPLLADQYSNFVVEEIRRLAPGGGHDPLDEAVSQLGSLIAGLPEKPDAYYHRARAFILGGREEEALLDLERAAAMGFLPARLLRANLQLRGGREAAARQEIEGAERAARPGWERTLVAAHRSLHEKEWEEAVAAFDQLIEIETGPGREPWEPYIGAALEFRLGRGAAQLMARNFEEAIQDFLIARERLPGSFDPIYLLARAYHHEGKKKVAENLLLKFHKRAPDRDEAVLAAAAFYHLIEEHDLALRWADRIGFQPLRDRVKMPILVGNGKKAKAIEIGERLLASGDADGIVFGNLAWAYYREDNDQAIAMAREAVRRDDKIVTGQVVLGYCLALKGEVDEGIQRLRKAAELSPGLEGWSYLARALIRKGEREEALSLFKRIEDYLDQSVVTRTSSHAWVHWWHGTLLESLGKPREALHAYAEVIAVPPRRGFWIDVLNRCLTGLLRCWDLGDAVPELDRLIALLTAIREGKLEADPRLLRALPLALLRHPVKGESREALLEAREALARRAAEDPQLLAAVAELEAAAGDLPAAVVSLEKALQQLGSEDPRLELRLAEYRERLLPSLASYDSADALLVNGSLEALIPETARWRFFRGVREPSEGLEWTALDFDDGGWEEGFGGVDLMGPYSTVYFRRRFEADPGALKEARLYVWANDAFVAYLNGEEVGRCRAGPAGVRLSPQAGAESDSQGAWAPDLVSIKPDALRPGENCLALQGLNRGGDYFFLLAMLLGVRTPAPLAVPVGFGVESAGKRRYLEGRLLEKEGKGPEAMGIFQRLVQEDPGSEQPRLRLAECLRQAGEFQAAEEALQAALAAFPRSAESWRLWHRLQALNLGFGAPELLRKIRALVPNAAEGYGADLLWIYERLAAGEAIRIDCGSEEDGTGADGALWGRDRFYEGGRISADPSSLLGGPYGTTRWFPLGRPAAYRLPLPPGNYRLTLHSAGSHFRKGGSRISGIRIEGEAGFKNYEPLKAGFAVPERITFERRVEDGALDLEFVHEVEDPSIDGIEVERLR